MIVLNNFQFHYIGLGLKKNSFNMISSQSSIPIQRLSYRDEMLFLIKLGPKDGLYNEDLFKQLKADNYIDNQKIMDGLDQLLQNGQIYEPRPDFFKTFIE